MFSFSKFRSRFKKTLRDSRGEMVVEVLVSLVILSLGAFAALQLMSITLVSNELTKERVIATNLAREGIEAVRNVRDTNWLRYSGERRRCWNNLDLGTCADTVDDDDVADPHIAHEQSYIAESGSDYRWTLTAKGPPRLDLTDGLDEEYRLYLGATDLYDHDNSGTRSVYFREIYTEYLDDDGAILTGVTPSANVIRVTSTVEWNDRGKISKVVLTTILTDYLGRANHE